MFGHSVKNTALLYFQMYQLRYLKREPKIGSFFGFIDTVETTKKVWMITLIADVSTEQIHVSIPKYICVVCIARLFV